MMRIVSAACVQIIFQYFGRCPIGPIANGRCLMV